MRSIKFFLFLGLIFTGIFGVSNLTKAATLPKIPVDFYVRLDSSGGMAPTSYYIEINGTDGTYDEFTSGDHRTVNFTLTQKELADIWAMFKKNSFTTIRTHQEKIYDRGGVTITRIANRTTVTKSDSGQSIVNAGSSARRFYDLVNYIQALSDAKTRSSYIPVNVTQTNTSGHELFARFDWDTPVGASTTFVELLPGNHTLDAWTMKDNSFETDLGNSINFNLNSPLDVFIKVTTNTIIFATTTSL